MLQNVNSTSICKTIASKKKDCQLRKPLSSYPNSTYSLTKPQNFETAISDCKLDDANKNCLSNEKVKTVKMEQLYFNLAEEPQAYDSISSQFMLPLPSYVNTVIVDDEIKKTSISYSNRKSKVKHNSKLSSSKTEALCREASDERINSNETCEKQKDCDAVLQDSDVSKGYFDVRQRDCKMPISKVNATQENVDRMLTEYDNVPVNSKEDDNIRQINSNKKDYNVMQMGDNALINCVGTKNNVKMGKNCAVLVKDCNVMLKKCNMIMGNVKKFINCNVLEDCDVLPKYKGLPKDFSVTANETDKVLNDCDTVLNCQCVTSNNREIKLKDSNAASKYSNIVLKDCGKIEKESKKLYLRQKLPPHKACICCKETSHRPMKRKRVTASCVDMCPENKLANLIENDCDYTVTCVNSSRSDYGDSPLKLKFRRTSRGMSCIN